MHLFDVRVSDWRGWLGAGLPVLYFALASLVVFALTGVSFAFAVGPLTFLGLLMAGSVLIAGARQPLICRAAQRARL